ncbi:hypothetical protein [Pseudomonas sp. PD9R]|uniref:hypothetical protein n=1 Tax=Pseudomonas sp. PD9R TaxID=2853534 RepID=UPI001C47785C|nr:hypothetical protein [Pseudomonas sp. PD9R]MBV6826919.1 hypothetical protein [Pseudomonas sp. PD9R]
MLDVDPDAWGSIHNVGAAAGCDLLILILILILRTRSKDRSLVSLDSSYQLLPAPTSSYRCLSEKLQVLARKIAKEYKCTP